MNKNICIVGDSFCAYRKTERHWPYYLTKLLFPDDNDHVPLGNGFSGAGWWSTRKQLIDCLNNYTPSILIIIHTDPNRLWSDENYPLNSMSTYDETKKFANNIPLGVWNATKDYYKHLYFTPWCEWAVTQWYIELDEIISSYKTIEKVIHFYSFKYPTNKKFHTGITVSEALFQFADDHLIGENQIVENHFTISKNKRFAEKIKLLLTNKYATKKVSGFRL